MKSILIFLIVFVTNYCQAQTAQFSINNKQFGITKTGKDTIIKGEHLLNFVQITFSLPSTQRKGSYDNVSMVFQGTQKGVYPLGCCDAKNHGEPYGNEVSGNWWTDTRNRENITSGSGYASSSSGNITITSIVDNKVSGSFICNVEGTKISGSFTDIEVRGLNDW